MRTGAGLSHNHANATVNSAFVSHSHIEDYASGVACALAGSTIHSHMVSYDPADNHQHLNVTLSFASADLGSPDWWEHKHLIGLVSMDGGGAGHAHAQVVASSICTLCSGVGSHTHAGGNSGSGGASHTHTIGVGVYTGNADPAGTPENHVHPFSFNTSLGSSHSHLRGGIALATCAKGKEHGHAHTTTTDSVTHRHALSGNSGAGGESPVVVKRAIGDGLTFVIYISSWQIQPLTVPAALK